MTRLTWMTAALAVFLLAPVATTIVARQAVASTQVTTAQAEATQPGVPPAPVAPSDTLEWALVFSFLTNVILRKMKDSSWFPMIKNGAGQVNFWLAGLISLAASLGIHTEFDKAAGILTITGLTIVGVTHGLGDWVKQWALTQMVHQATPQPQRT